MTSHLHSLGTQGLSACTRCGDPITSERPCPGTPPALLSLNDGSERERCACPATNREHWRTPQCPPPVTP
jgi:hypothetical protein